MKTFSALCLLLGCASLVSCADNTELLALTDRIAQQERRIKDLERLINNLPEAAAAAPTNSGDESEAEKARGEEMREILNRSESELAALAETAAQLQRRASDLDAMTRQIKSVAEPALPENATDIEKARFERVVQMLDHLLYAEEKKRFWGGIGYVAHVQQQRRNRMFNDMKVNDGVKNRVAEIEKEYTTKVEAIWDNLKKGVISPRDAKNQIWMEQESAKSWMRQTLDQKQLDVYNKYTGGVEKASQRRIN